MLYQLSYSRERQQGSAGPVVLQQDPRLLPLT